MKILLAIAFVLGVVFVSFALAVHWFFKTMERM